MCEGTPIPRTSGPLGVRKPNCSTASWLFWRFCFGVVCMVYVRCAGVLSHPSQRVCLKGNKQAPAAAVVMLCIVPCSQAHQGRRTATNLLFDCQSRRVLRCTPDTPALTRIQRPTACV